MRGFQSRWQPPVGSQIDWGHPIAKGLVGCWLFNEGGGGIARDIGKLKSHAVASGLNTSDIWLPLKRVGHSFSYVDASTGSFNTSSLVGDYMNGKSAFSLSVWLKARATNLDNGIITNDMADTDNADLSMRYDTAGFFGGGNDVIKYGPENGGESAALSQTTDLQHLCITWTGGANSDLFIDGRDGTPTNEGGAGQATLSTAGNTLNIGEHGQGSSATWNGAITNVTLWERKLTPDEVLQIYVEPFVYVDYINQRQYFFVAAAAATGNPHYYYVQQM